MNLNVQEYILLYLAAAVPLMWLINIAPLSRTFGEERCAAASKWVLTLLSYGCLYSIDLRLALMLALTTLFAHIITLRPVKQRFGENAKRLGIILSVAMLCVFKYFNFFLDSFCSLFGKTSPGPLILFVPLGVSYFVFSVISFICESYRLRPCDSEPFTDTALYISFFIKFISGPIVRYNDYLKDSGLSRRPKLRNFERGIQMIAIGLFKKIVIADHLSPFVDQIYKTPAVFNTFTVWLGVISYTLQLYFDFSGYSDMVIGGADILGFSFARNFDMPFAACSIQDFWRRWHISLSTWFRDYVYIPLGGNRKGKLRTGINKTVVFLLTGFWHGASLTFVVWGLIHGFFILLETYGIINPSKWKFKPLRYIYTMFVVTVAFMLFRADSFATASAILRRMFIPSAGVTHPYTWTFFAIALLAASAVYTGMKNRRASGSSGALHAEYPCLDLSSFWGLTVFITFVGLTLLLACFTVEGFIYAQF